MEKRFTCPQCERPKKTCLCPYIKVQCNKKNLIIIRHPNEISHPKGTGILAHKTFQNSILLNSDFLEDLALLLNDKYACLLYPEQENEEIKELSSEDDFDTLIVVDSTWRKAKRIFQNNKELNAIPKRHLPTNLHSINYMRKNPKKYFLSTFESSLYALEIIEQASYQESLNVIKKMNEIYQSFCPTHFFEG